MLADLSVPRSLLKGQVDEKWSCYASHWECSDGIWDIWNQCEVFDWSATHDDDTSADCTYGSAECVGQPCKVNKKIPVFRDSGIVYNCVDGVWVEDWEYGGTGSTEETWYDDFPTSDVPVDLNEYTTNEICYELCTRQTLGGQKHTMNSLPDDFPGFGDLLPDDPGAELQACLERCLGPLLFNDDTDGSAVDDEDSETGSGTGSETGSEVTNPYSASEICDNSGCVGWPCDEDRIPIVREHEDSGYYVYSCVDGIWVDEFEYYDTTTTPTNDQTTTEPFVTTLTPIATTTSDFATTTMAPSACDEDRTYECPENSFCVPAENFVTFTCQCKSGYFLNGNMCRKQSPEAESCPADFKKDLFKMNLDGLKDPKYYLNKGSVMIQVESQVVSRFRSGLISEIHLISGDK